MVRLPTHRPPTHPGEMLRAEFLEPMALTQRDLAERIRVSYDLVNRVVNGRRNVSSSLALRLARYFGTTPDFWLNLQQRWDLYVTGEAEERELASIKPHRPDRARRAS